MSSVNDIPNGWVETTLGEVIHFANNKIEVARIGLENYVSTENLLANKEGVTIASSLPNISKVNKFEEGDTLFSNIRTYFKKVWYADKMGGSSNDVLLFRPNDTNELDSKFLRISPSPEVLELKEPLDKTVAITPLGAKW